MVLVLVFHTCRVCIGENIRRIFNGFTFDHRICICNHVFNAVFLQRGEFSSNYHFVCITSAAKTIKEKMIMALVFTNKNCQDAYY